MIPAEVESTHPEEEDHGRVEDLEEPGGAPVTIRSDAYLLLDFVLVETTKEFHGIGGFGHRENLKSFTNSS